MKGWQVEKNGLTVQKTLPYPGGAEVKIYINKDENVYEVWVQIHDRTFQPHGFLRETFTTLEQAQACLYEDVHYWDVQRSDMSNRRVPFGGGGR